MREKYFRSTVGFLFMSLVVILSPLMTINANAQATWVTLHEADFRPDGGDPNRFVLGNNLKGADNDVIHLKTEKVTALRDKIEIVLVASSNVRWWKGITIFKVIDAPQRPYGFEFIRYKHIDTQDDDKSDSSTPITISDLGDSAVLSFEKAKAFGAHTAMYSFWLKEKDKPFKYAGYRLTFSWERDG